MIRLVGMSLQNCKGLRDVSIGRTSRSKSADPLPNTIALIGPNGAGKSTLLEVLAFVSESLSVGVEAACNERFDAFERLRTQGASGMLGIEITYRESAEGPLLSYSIHLDQNGDGRVYVSDEWLEPTDSTRTYPPMGGFPNFAVVRPPGKAATYLGRAVGHALTDPRRLALATLGTLESNPPASALLEYVSRWHTSDFNPPLAKMLPAAGPQTHLGRFGENLANYVQYLEKEHPTRFQSVLDAISKQIPGLERVGYERTVDDRLLLKFNERGYSDPFYAKSISDGTLKLFAYLLLLEDPDPAPLILIDEPENGLHHQVLGPLANAIRQKSNTPGGPQVIVATHANYFIDGLHPREVFVVSKSKDGGSTIHRASDDLAVQGMFDEGIPLGSLWYSNHLVGGNP